MGFYLLATTRRVKRWLVPPMLLTTSLFVALFWWSWSAVERFIEAARAGSIESLGLKDGWLRDVALWLLERGVVIALAKLSGFLVFSVFALFLGLWIFSIAYEAISGPFLDEIQGRIEERWFGKDPWKSIERPNAISAARRAWITIAASAGTTLAILLAWLDAGGEALAWGFLAPVPFIAAALLAPDWRQWFAWAVTAQLRTLFVSFKASLFAGAILVLFFWVKFIPGVGYFAFAALAGFSTAISLFDIPFSRRRFSLGQRFAFLIDHLLAVVIFGAVAGAVFVIPFAGPLIGVPAASIGGLWLLCRLDKNPLRPLRLRLEPGARAP